MMIDGWGVAVDRVISDFVQGTVEWMLEEGEERGDWIIVEGQGSLDHPAYSLGDARAHPRLDAARDGHGPQAGPRGPRLRPPARTPRFPIAKLPGFIKLHEQVAGLVAPSKVVGDRAEHDALPDDDEARRVIAEIAAETGLPTDDPVRFGGDRLWRGDRGCGRCAAVGRTARCRSRRG